jgi:hypothetical protein
MITEFAGFYVRGARLCVPTKTEFSSVKSISVEFVELILSLFVIIQWNLCNYLFSTFSRNFACSALKFKR